ncbi:MAG: hemerythrin family protein [Azoarcus sp.]|jgi:hemerythrin|nr:hemerythrin family protein [Azoarcus sp.]
MPRPLFIQWQNKSNTGVPLLDEQHRGLVSIINSLYFLTERGTCDIVLCISACKTIKSASRIHFLTEERILQAAEYPDLENHIEIHKKLTIELERSEKEALINNDPMVFLKFLKKWWVEHINEDDMDYVPCLREYEKRSGNLIY